MTRQLVIGTTAYRWPLRGDAVLTAWRAARSRKGVDRNAGVVYAECLRQGRVLSVKSAAAACGVPVPVAKRALAALATAQLIPAMETTR